MKNTAADRLMAHVSALAQWERLSGSQQELEAFRYITRQLEDFGLRPQLVEHDAYISLPESASLSVVAPISRSLPCITHAFSQPTGAEGLEAELVYVGSGSPAEYEGLDVQGKIVLVDGLAAPGPALAAGRHGAIGHIHVNPAEHVHEMIISPVWGSPTPEQVALLPKTAAVSVNHAAGSQLKELLKEGAVRIRLQAAVDTGWRKIPLLTAEVLGTEEPDQFLLFSGHVDSWYYGAMDNGAANAVMLELARHFAGQPLRRTLRLAFWSGHSHGRYAGSAWYADEYWAELNRNCVAHVNIDSPGGAGATVIEEPQVMGEALRLLQEVLGSFSGRPLSPRRIPRAGDHSFWGIGISSLLVGPSEQQAGPKTYNPIAGVMASDAQAAGYGWWWHTQSDTVDKLDPVILERDARIYRAVLERLLGDPVLPFDFTPVIHELKQLVGELGPALAGRLDLGSVQGVLSALEAQVGEVVRIVAAGTVEPARVNRCLVGLSRILVPLLYTQGGRFHPDPALPVPPAALLTALRQLAQTTPDSDEARFQRVAAVRALNQLQWTLEQALLTAHALTGVSS